MRWRWPGGEDVAQSGLRVEGVCFGFVHFFLNIKYVYIYIYIYIFFFFFLAGGARGALWENEEMIGLGGGGAFESLSCSSLGLGFRV